MFTGLHDNANDTTPESGIRCLCEPFVYRDGALLFGGIYPAATGAESARSTELWGYCG